MRICLITCNQPSNNPRLVKEADALTEAGYEVHAICADSGLWPSRMDPVIMRKRRWTYAYAAGNARRPWGYIRRARHRIAGQFWNRAPVGSAMHRAALSHVAPELERAARRFQADLYIAHYPQALPAAVMAGKKYGSSVGYDAEDLHTAMWEYSQGPGPEDLLTEQIEEHYLRSCDYVTTAAPGFSAYYAQKYSVQPVTILNVFPLAERSSDFRNTNPSEPLRLYWFSQHIGERRGLEDVVRAMGLLRELRLELHLRGTWIPGYRERLFAIADSVQLSRHRIFSYPPAPADEMVPLASGFDIGLALEQTLDENRNLCLTNKLFVYLLAGNAIAATASKGQRMIGENLGQAMFTYEPGDAEALAAGLRKWFIDRDSLDRARQLAWDLGTSRYNWDREKKTFLAEVNRVIRRRAA
jgi:glycosyltransferase involved in cell wall biosynthesis